MGIAKGIWQIWHSWSQPRLFSKITGEWKYTGPSPGPNYSVKTRRGTYASVFFKSSRFSTCGKTPKFDHSGERGPLTDCYRIVTPAGGELTIHNKWDLFLLFNLAIPYLRSPLKTQLHKPNNTCMKRLLKNLSVTARLPFKPNWLSKLGCIHPVENYAAQRACGPPRVLMPSDPQNILANKLIMPPLV